MLCGRFRRILLTKTGFNSNTQCRCIVATRLILKQCRIDELLASIVKNNNEIGIMSSVRFILRDLGINKLRNVWSRGLNVGNVMRRYRRDRSVRDVIVCFRQAFFRPRRTLLLSATAAYKAKGGDDVKSPNCVDNITDEELEALVSEVDAVEELSRTLYCAICNKRLMIDKKQPGIRYCICKETHSPAMSDDGWEPYMEAEDVIIWRKEYKPGQGLYAYKVYGRYREVTAKSFAAVQVDNSYRRVWDSAVAALTVVERSPSVPDQAVLHWEVLWPRLFANRDYVYIRRHKEYEVTTKSTNSLFEEIITPVIDAEERPSVHSNAKRKAIENYSRIGDQVSLDNKVYVIVSKSCEHAKVPETKHAIRVSEYWSHMVVRTIHGADNPGMEFVLTYYDEPAVGGLPSGVAAWATGRAAPAYLHKMRLAAKDYTVYRQNIHPELPDTVPELEKVAYEESKVAIRVNEQDMESSKQGPEIETGETTTKEQSTQTDDSSEVPVKVIESTTQTDSQAVKASEIHTQTDSQAVKASESDTQTDSEAVKASESDTQTDSQAVKASESHTQTGDSSVAAVKVIEKTVVTEDKAVQMESMKDTSKSEGVPDDSDSEEETNTRWWRYLHPFYYFV